MQRNLRKAAFFSFMAAASALGLSAQAFKVAIVNAQKAVADTQEIKKAQADLSAKYRPRQQDIEKLQTDLQQIQGQLRGPNVTPQQEQQLSADAQLKQKQLQRLGEDLQQDFNRDRSDILNRAGQRMQEIIRKIAEEKGLDIVVDVSNTLYFKPALEITPEATAAYDKAYPMPAAK